MGSLRWPQGLAAVSLLCCLVVAAGDGADSCVDGAHERSAATVDHEVLMLQTDVHLAKRSVQALSSSSRASGASVLEVIREFTPIFAVLLGLCILVVLTMTLGAIRHDSKEAALSTPPASPAAGRVLAATKPLPKARILTPAPVPLPSESDQGPPPICPSLILPNTEARFMVSLHSIRTADKLDIRGTSGRKLLTASFSTGTAQPFLCLACVGCEGDPRCTVAANGEATSALTVLGRKNDFYGVLEPMEHSSGEGALLKCNGVLAMTVEVLQRSALHVVISTPSKRLLAQGREDAEGTWQLKVEPGTDAVLIISCILALDRLWPA